MEDNNYCQQKPINHIPTSFGIHHLNTTFVCRHHDDVCGVEISRTEPGDSISVTPNHRGSMCFQHRRNVRDCFLLSEA